MRGLLRRLDGWQRTRSWVGFPFAVVKKFGEDQAGNLAALIAYYAFFSVFPLLLAFATILGFVLHGHPDWQRTIEHSAFSQLPLVSDKNQPAPLTGNVPALVVGISLALWSGLGVAKSAQTAFNTVYLVAHTDRPNFLKSTLRALGLITFGGIGLIVTTGLSSAITSVHSIGGVQVGIGLRIVGTAIAVVLNTALFLVLFRWLTVRPVRWRDALPGALLSAVVLQILQLGAADVPQVLVFNKLDAIDAGQQPRRGKDLFDLEGIAVPRLFVSGRTSAGVPELRRQLALEVSRKQAAGAPIRESAQFHDSPL